MSVRIAKPLDDRRRRVELLIEHSRNPRHKRALEGAGVVAMPGGSPECGGGSVVIYLEGDGNDAIRDVAWTGQGDTISMAGTSIVIERVHDGGLTMQEVLDLDYDEIVGSLGRDVIGSRTSNATLGLSTLKSAVRKYLKDRR